MGKRKFKKTKSTRPIDGVVFFSHDWCMKHVCFAFFVCVATACSGPVPGELAPNEPYQTETEESTWEAEGYQVEALAEYDIQARVLSRKKYSHDLSPLDLALGWEKMSDPAVYGNLSISQSGRWYHYRWRNKPPIPLGEIISQSANVHMIPKDPDIRKKLMKIDEGDVVHLTGKLVQVTKENPRFVWKSSLRRDDSGDGACELLWVEDVEIIVD